MMNTLDLSQEFDATAQPASLQKVVARLQSITGLVTTLHTEKDLRPCVFSRFLHVQRTTWTAQWLTQARSKYGHRLEPSKVAWLAWAHDVNRWPFAHNAEINFLTKQKRFDQADDVELFCRENDIFIEQQQIVDLKAIINRNSTGLSSEARVVLLADMVTGFLEDAVLAIVGLDLIPEFIPAEVAQILHLPLANKLFRVRLLELNRCLHIDHAVDRFKNEFNVIFCEAVVRFLTEYGFDKSDPLGSDFFTNIRSVVREQFLGTRLFPFNNEKISRGSLLRGRIVDPLLDILGDKAASALTSVDENTLLTLARDHSLIPSDSPEPFVPLLDYAENQESKLSFRKNEC